MEVIDVKQLVKLYGISKPTAYKLVHAQGFPKFFIGRNIRIYKDLLPEFFSKQAEGGITNGEISGETP